MKQSPIPPKYATSVIGRDIVYKLKLKVIPYLYPTYSGQVATHIPSKSLLYVAKHSA